MTTPIRTAEEILKQYGRFVSGMFIPDPSKISLAMEEYASQFKAQPIQVTEEAWMDLSPYGAHPHPKNQDKADGWEEGFKAAIQYIQSIPPNNEGAINNDGGIPAIVCEIAKWWTETDKDEEKLKREIMTAIKLNQTFSADPVISTTTAQPEGAISREEGEYKIIPNEDSQTITVPAFQELWVNGILLPCGTYRYKPPQQPEGEETVSKNIHEKIVKHHSREIFELRKELTALKLNQPDQGKIVEVLKGADDLFLDMGLIGGQGHVMHARIELLRDKIKAALLASGEPKNK